MSRGPYSKRISDANVMLAGIKSQKSKLETRGLTDQYIEKFEILVNDAVETNNKQEKAKTDLADLTQQLNEKVVVLEKEYQYVKRIVMTEIPNHLWQEFGMKYNYKKPKPESEEPEQPAEKKEKTK